MSFFDLIRNLSLFANVLGLGVFARSSYKAVKSFVTAEGGSAKICFTIDLIIVSILCTISIFSTILIFKFF